MHLFNTNRAQTASYMGRVLVPIPDGMSAWGNNAWQQLSLHASLDSYDLRALVHDSHAVDEY